MNFCGLSKYIAMTTTLTFSLSSFRGRWSSLRWSGAANWGCHTWLALLLLLGWLSCRRPCRVRPDRSEPWALGSVDSARRPHRANGLRSLHWRLRWLLWRLHHGLLNGHLWVECLRGTTTCWVGHGPWHGAWVRWGRHAARSWVLERWSRWQPWSHWTLIRSLRNTSSLVWWPDRQARWIGGTRWMRSLLRWLVVPVAWMRHR